MRMTNTGKTSWFLAALMGMNASQGAAEERGIPEIAAARAEQVEAMRARGEDEGVGTYGVPMSVLVGAGYVDGTRSWKEPSTATWSGKEGINSAADFIQNADAQMDAYAFYLNGAFEHMSVRKPEIRIELDGETYGIRDVMKIAAYAKPHELVDFVMSGDAKSLDMAAKKAGYENGRTLARTAFQTEPDLPSVSL